MKPSWTLRQLLAILRGLTIMVGLFWALVLLQLAPALFRRGFTGVHDLIVRVAIAGLPPDQWENAIARFQLALGSILAVGVLLFIVQRYLGRKLSSYTKASRT
jgi:hypothetical protein